MLQLFVQTYHQLLSAFGTSMTNAYSTHFVKSFGLNAKAKYHWVLGSSDKEREAGLLIGLARTLYMHRV